MTPNICQLAPAPDNIGTKSGADPRGRWRGQSPPRRLLAKKLRLQADQSIGFISTRMHPNSPFKFLSSKIGSFSRAFSPGGKGNTPSHTLTPRCPSPTAHESTLAPTAPRPQAAPFAPLATPFGFVPALH